MNVITIPPSSGKGARGIGPTAAALLFSVTLAAIPAHADLARCQSGVQSETNRLIGEISKALQSCAATARRAQAVGGNLHRAADQCERNLMKVYNAAAVPGRSAFERFRASIERLHPRRCTDESLLAMGYFVPGINAPGARGPCVDGGKACVRDSECTGKQDSCPGAMGDVAQRLTAQADETARRAQLQIVPDLVDLLAPLIDLKPGPDGALGTADCSSPLLESAPTGYRKRPNLCRLRPFLPCTNRQCRLSLDSGITLSPLGIPIQLSDHTLPVEICIPDNAGGKLMHFSVAAHTVVPPPTIPLHSPITACVELVSSAGWCDCDGTGHGGPFEPELCIDHIIDAQGKDDCGPSSTLLDQEDDCGCAFIGGAGQPEPLPPCTTPGCERCVRRDGDGPCHPGTRNGSLQLKWNGASQPNDCLLRSSMKLSFLPPAFCLDAAGQVRGACPAPGPADPLCKVLGGVACADARGPNGVACDADDTTPWTLPPFTVDLTTGSSKSRVADFVLAEGVCTAPGNPNCVEDRNCVAPATCAGAIFGCGSGAAANDCEASAGPGAGVSCAGLRSGSIAGWKLVGTAAGLDHPAGLRDSLMTITLECD